MLARALVLALRSQWRCTRAGDHAPLTLVLMLMLAFDFALFLALALLLVLTPRYSSHRSHWRWLLS